ncbi:unnamed protein product [Alopecurus aequalis]
MSGEGADETDGSCRLSPAAAAAPLDSDDLLGEILLRLPPLPSSLPRVSAVSKLWGSLATSAAFHRRFRAHHRKLKLPILGLFHGYSGCILFTSVLDPPDRIPSERFSLQICGDESSDTWSMLGCRHGRVLVINRWRPELLVFHPVSGDRRIVHAPPEFDGNGIRIRVHGAVFCSAGDDHSSHFKVVLVGTKRGGDPAIARVYSSETGMWGDLVSTAEPCGGSVIYLPSTLIGNALYWWLNGLPILDISTVRMRIIRAEDGGVGIGVLSYPSFHMWDLKVDCHGATEWVLRKTVNMRDIIGLSSLLNAKMVFIAGYAEDADKVVISVPVYRALITVQLESMKVEKYRGTIAGYSYHPFTDFFTAGTVRARGTTPAFDPHQPSSHRRCVV